MHGSVVRMSALINNVMDFARGRLGGGFALSRRAGVDLEPLLQQVVDGLLHRGWLVHKTDFMLPNPVNCTIHPASGRWFQIWSPTASAMARLTGRSGSMPRPMAPNWSCGSPTKEISTIHLANRERLFQPFFRE